ncbi:MAG: ferrous iron transport protein A [Clostridiales bacterium]|nr:ferrous iron transport protein A [Clostridiales bacterium]MCD8370497.1 ferrous iron transport protein A [Clostridiales bacterium]
MKTLKDIAVGTTVTVRKVSGGREVRKKLERMGIMAGSDLTVLETGADGTQTVSGLRGQLRLDAQESAFIGVGEHFVRRDEPVLLGGCCAYGDTTEMLRRMEAVYAEKEKKTESSGNQQKG